ncbi:sn-glycerol-3-phosphate transporter [Pseudomonas citronellolis]|uniref:sn-glycerol-3-phosphate transporter n=1 Tax=Pseudomonas citronellolis TaxID=53408 RepID=UPI0023E3F3D9|nr:sn-glycerol-3-phosphate transporter [Pseudomonas citronellolis]MDF3931773.1 sn-glycerol-3-phosphate transporter [Pseudomonas citronellolis]
MKKLLIPLIALLLAPLAWSGEGDGDTWYLQTSVMTRHWNHDPDHNNHQELIGLERNRADGWVWGGATFRNSFRQRSNYVYAGKRFDLEDTPFYVKVTGGAIQGYHGKYRDKIPLNHYGVAPAIIPSVGMQFGRFGAEFVALGANAGMINVGMHL